MDAQNKFNEFSTKNIKKIDVNWSKQANRQTPRMHAQSPYSGEWLTNSTEKLYKNKCKGGEGPRAKSMYKAAGLSENKKRRNERCK